MSIGLENQHGNVPLHILSAPLPGKRPDYADLPPIPRHRPVDALYVHVPFCTTKCHYCDFYSIAGHLDQADAYLQALQVETSLWNAHTGRISPETIFIGGGTPTLLDPNLLERLLVIIEQAIDTSRLQEFSVEANPNTFDPARAAVLARHGVNRLSFGAQSFVPSELRTLQRDHDPENVPKAFNFARHAGIDNLNVDLIFGIPGQTLATWEFSLSQALALHPTHMSCYSLIYEPNTPMTARMKKGEFTPIDEELELQMFQHVYQRMRQAGFVRYEVSNYALAGEGPGCECRHNIHYWKGSQWMAWGPSAAGHLNGWRWKNAASLAHYLDALTVRSTGFSLSSPPILPLTQMEHLPPRAWAAEVAVFWLRLAEGLSYSEFLDRTGVDARPVMERILKNYAEMGFVQLSPHRTRLTEKAVPVSNRILADVLAAF